MSWENRVAGRTLNLGNGPELEVDLDAAERRIGITGWKFSQTQEMDGPAAEETGLRAGVFKPEFDDSSWTAVMTPNVDIAPRTGYAWVRRKLKLDDSDRGKPIYFTLGGFGLFDFRDMRVFLNGQLIGTREPTHLRRGPMTIALRPDSPDYSHLRFGADNTLAIQLGGYQYRLARLDALDPEKRWDLSRFYWPPTFEQVVAIGGDRATPEWRVTNVVDHNNEVVFTLSCQQPALEATVTYRWNEIDGVLHKFVKLQNTGDKPVRVLDVHLGTYATGATTAEGEQGHPVYADNAFFFGVAHPAGWSTGEDGEVKLHHHPGKTIAPHETLDCFETVYGVSKPNAISTAFKDYIRSHMRRTMRHHDHPYAFIEPFGSDELKDKYDATEARLMPNLNAVADFTRETGCHFDAWDIEFWEDLHGDRSAPDPVRFPNGFTNLHRVLDPMHTALGLWMDITGPDQSIGQNPAIARTLNFDPAYGTERRTMCLATDPMPAINRDAFVKHLKEGVRLLKFDGYWAACRNNDHAHLPGIYATEAIDSAFITLLHELDHASPDCFFELYGGYHSPWWLLHADTIYESGIQMEAATPGPWPTLFARDGVTRVLDMATTFAEQDTPAIGKDSLGVWLSDWKWNSQIGKERWQEGFVMDLMRGSLLAQPWCDPSKMDKAERSQLAEFIALLRAYPKCFDHPHLILGDPWKSEPYGWCGTDGRRAFIAINNGTWNDQTIELELNEKWGLPKDQRWNLFRRYPNPVRLRGSEDTFPGSIKFAMRPFEIDLLEAVPAGEAPALDRQFKDEPIPNGFKEKSTELEVNVSSADAKGFRTLTIELPRTARGTVAITADARQNNLPLMRKDAGSHYAIESPEGTKWTSVLANQLYYKTSWQAWRTSIAPADHSRTLTLQVKSDAEPNAEVRFEGRLIDR